MSVFIYFVTSLARSLFRQFWVMSFGVSCCLQLLRAFGLYLLRLYFFRSPVCLHFFRYVCIPLGSGFFRSLCLYVVRYFVFLSFRCLRSWLFRLVCLYVVRSCASFLRVPFVVSFLRGLLISFVSPVRYLCLTYWLYSVWFVPSLCLYFVICPYVVSVSFRQLFLQLFHQFVSSLARYCGIQLVIMFVSAFVSKFVRSFVRPLFRYFFVSFVRSFRRQFVRPFLCQVFLSCVMHGWFFLYIVRATYLVFRVFRQLFSSSCSFVFVSSFFRSLVVCQFVSSVFMYVNSSLVVYVVMSFVICLFQP